MEDFGDPSSSPCDYCKRRNGAFLRCKLCLSTYYCSEQCEAAHRDQHRPICESLMHKSIAFELLKHHTMEGNQLIESKGTINLSKRCVVCSMKNDNTNVRLPCSHTLCYLCMSDHEEFCSDRLNINTCPLCRTGCSDVMGAIYSDQFTFKKFSSYILRAEMVALMSNQQQHVSLWCGMAREEYKKLPSPIASLIECKALLAKLLYLESDIPMSARKAREVYDATKKDPTTAKAIAESCLEILADCYMQVGDYTSFKAITQTYFSDVGDDDSSRSVKTERKLFHYLSRCLYEEGNYEAAIEFGESGILIDRHTEGCYDYVARAHKALNRIDLAQDTVHNAARYEAPWNPQYQETVLAPLMISLKHTPITIPTNNSLLQDNVYIKS